ncbi:RIMS-binding protein 2-like [Schistocerca serialis cubense]|uniref:RIMS-binding protein 2-like n=1 Tax=Schistocerca serialis cubense TaxID=2023355 RepID=UPI00214E82BB|nr:RIMS-binding protein 2-like [Schistocerca serialis cubense]
MQAPISPPEITKDSASEGNFSEDDYLADRRGPPPRGHHGPVGATGHYDPRGVPRSHAERGRPPLLPHERGAQRGPDPHQPPRGRDRMDERDQYYMDGVMRGDPRARHAGHPAYRGPPPPGGRGPPPPRDKRTRWFVALFDYDPTTMSPNPDACEEELPFSEGDTIKVYGEKDADGFYWGECRGRRGYVPHNMVVEVQDMPKNSIEPVRGQHPHPSHGPPHSRDRWGDIYANMPVKKMIALYDYDPQELSPNVDAEVSSSSSSRRRRRRRRRMDTCTNLTFYKIILDIAVSVARLDHSAMSKMYQYLLPPAISLLKIWCGIFWSKFY